MAKPSDKPQGKLEDRIAAAADRLERMEQGFQAVEIEPPPGHVPAEFKLSTTRLLHDLGMLRGDIVKMREEAAQMRAVTLSRTEFEARRRRLVLGGMASFIVLALALATFLVFQSRSNSAIARFEASTRKFQQEAIAACQIRNSRIGNELAFRENVLKLLATVAETPANKARNPEIARQYAAAVARYRLGLGTTVDCTKQSQALGNG